MNMMATQCPYCKPQHPKGERENKLECPAIEAEWGGRNLIGGWEGYWVHWWWWRMDTGGGMGLRTLHEGKTSTKMCEPVIVPSL